MSGLLLNIFNNFLGDSRKNNPSKGQVAYDCPMCSAEKGMPRGDGKGNLEINYEHGVFNCWACGQRNGMKGRIPYLIKRFGNKDLLKEYYLLKPETEYKEKEIKLISELPKEFIPFSKHNNSLIYKQGLDYLYRRNVNDVLIDRFNIGYAEEGTYQKRIIIPSYGINGEVNFFSNRSIETKTGFAISWPKYKNPEADKDAIIFNEKLLSWNSTIYLVEGAFDHIVVPNSIPLLGKTLSPYLTFMLYNYAKSDIVIFIDGEAYNDALDIYRELNIGKLHGRIKIIKVAEDYDSSRINEEYGKKGLLQVLKTARKLSEQELWKDVVGKKMNNKFFI